MKIALITSATDQFIADMICRFKDIDGVNFDNVIYWNRQQSLKKKIRLNLKKNGLLYIPYRILLSINSVIKTTLYRPFENFFLAKPITKDLFKTCREKNIRIHEIDDVHSPEGRRRIQALDLDLLVVCGTGILKPSVFDLPKQGTVNLHQGDVKKYKGAPPGFWELWNDAKKIGVTIHYVNQGVDTGDIIQQRIVPIFPYDTLISLQNKVAEISLDLYPDVLRQITKGNITRIKQTKGTGKQYFLPTLKEKFILWCKIKKRQCNPSRFVNSLLKTFLFPCILFFIYLRDHFLLKKGKTIVSSLYYHRVTDICQDGMTTGISLFEKQIRFLKKHYTIITLFELQEILDKKNHPFRCKKCCLITFDDGYEDNYINALPVLKKYGCPATFFISTGMIDNELQFPHDKDLQPQLSFKKMTWKQLSTAMQSNITIGLHTHTHCNLGETPVQEGIDEIDTSIQSYREHFGSEPVFMSIPFGQKQDIRLELLTYIQEHTDITMLFSAYGGKNISPINRYDIKRGNVCSEKGIEFWMRLEGHLRTLTYPA